MVIKDLAKPFGSQGFLIGIGVAALAYFLGPQLKQAVKPAAIKGAQGVMTLKARITDIFDRFQSGFENMKETTINDPAANGTANEIVITQAEKIRDEISKRYDDEKENTRKAIEDMNKTISGLRKELTDMKKNAGPQEA